MARTITDTVDQAIAEGRIMAKNRKIWIRRITKDPNAAGILASLAPVIDTPVSTGDALYTFVTGRK